MYDPAKGTCVRDSKYKNTLIGLNTCSGPGNFAKDGKCIKYNQDTQYVMKSRLVNLSDNTQRIEDDQIITCPEGSKIKYKPTDTLTMFLKADPGIPGSTDRYQTSPIGNTFCEAPAGKHYNISKNTFETCPKDTIDMEDFNNTDDENKKKMGKYLKYVNNQACIVDPKLKETKAISYDTDENKVIDNNIPNFKCPTNSKVDTYVSNTCICNDVNGDKYYWIPPEVNLPPPTTSTPDASQSTTSTTTPEPYSPLIKNSDDTYGLCVNYNILDQKLKEQKMKNLIPYTKNPALVDSLISITASNAAINASNNAKIKAEASMVNPTEFFTADDLNTEAIGLQETAKSEYKNAETAWKKAENIAIKLRYDPYYEDMKKSSDDAKNLLATANSTIISNQPTINASDKNINDRAIKRGQHSSRR